MTKEKIVLIDGNSLAYRAFFALPQLTNDKGVFTNATYGFTMMLERIVTDIKPTKMLVAFDAGKTTFRHSTYEAYKGGRDKTPSELSEQFPYIRKLIDAYHIARYELPNYEADDIIGTLARQAEAQGDEIIVISGDKDLTQLASEHITVQITRKGITDIDAYTPAFIEEKYGLTPLQIIDMKGLMGDKSDNIPGVPGIGEKTAIKLLKEYGSIENLYEHVSDMKPSKMKEKLIDNREQAFMSKELATILVEAPITIGLDDLAYEGEDSEAVTAIYEELQFKTLLAKRDTTTAVVEAEALDVRCVDEVTAQMLTSPMALHVELENERYHNCAILGLGLSNGDHSYYIPFEVAKQSTLLTDWLAGDSVKYVSDSKAARAALLRFDLPLNHVAFDLLLAAYIDNPARSGVDVAPLAEDYGYGGVQTTEAIYGKGAKWQVPEQSVLAQHVGRIAHAIYSVQPKVEAALKDKEQFTLYNELELPLAAILSAMESEGITVNAETLQVMGEQLTTKLHKLEQAIYELAGSEFNINSPKQLGVILFEQLGLPPVKKTKTGYSTAADVLEKLRPQHAIIEYILQYRQLGKLQSTYIEGLLKEIHDDHKVHTRFQQALTATGRLSSTDPNLQNIPIRLEEGRKIRQAFVASEKDWVLFAADYSQIELRVLAHMSQDENLVSAFKEGMDIHTRTAMDVFHVAREAVDGNMRRAAKAVNFGIVYGISDYGLSQNLDIPRKEAKTFIDKYFEVFPGVKQYMEDIVEIAKKDGYVSTLLNRRRYLPDLASSNFNVRSFAERTAMNTPIQGSAADIIKKAMIDMNARLQKEGLRTRLLLQVHDELIFEAPQDEIERLIQIVPEVMENTVALSVPLKVDYSYGPTWYDAK
ncbi:DNA polymerase I [Lysinibacillus sp. BF-4]|uniref:DNA polymerase I n=1 Tax=Lysinibacillus sp. BF-4 TaxID=1473546 RepID=UPI0005075405|nr:DNA polymerase I [Lysinibacillus sp. BF-4]KFL44143.1 DNA polymerase I [Lysinibacillus sp. BF-4]